MFRFIKLNKARCLRCNSIVISRQETTSMDCHCDCGNLVISGGTTHLIRTGVLGKDYEELSVININQENCPEIKEDTQDPPPFQDKLLGK
jgi:hypothetical protein